MEDNDCAHASMHYVSGLPVNIVEDHIYMDMLNIYDSYVSSF
jgi:hypothetical protein